MGYDLIFLASGKDFHAIDWYRNVKSVSPDLNCAYVTDLISSESETEILTNIDNVIKLFIIDKFLFKKRSKIGDKWRNLIKLSFFPVQIYKLKLIINKNPKVIVHAHTMYYTFLCWILGIKYISSPQGSEILVRPFQSKLYKYFATFALKGAESIIIDSQNLKDQIYNLSGRDSFVIQYGIDVKTILGNNPNSKLRNKITSIRGLYPLYRIDEIIKARNSCKEFFNLTFFYPFHNEIYKNKVFRKLIPGDTDYGRMPEKKDIYNILFESILAISIPISDSSPRSVAEAIFCGACVAVTYSRWIDTLPYCMRERIIIINLNDPKWLDNAIEKAKLISNKTYHPSNDAIKKYDQLETMRVVSKNFYKLC
jgi:hypothetical protein